MAAEGIARKEQYVGDHQHAAQADAEVSTEVEGDERVVPEEQDLHERGVESEAVKVVEDQRRSGFGTVAAPAGLWHGARTWMPEERSEVSLAVVVAGEPKSGRRPAEPVSWRDGCEVDQWRVERAEIGSETAGGLEEDDPGGKDDEQAECADDEGGVEPVGEGAVRVPDRSCMLGERHREALSNYLARRNNSGGAVPPELAVRTRCHAGVVAAFIATLTVTRLRAVTNSKTMAPRTTMAASIRPNAA